MGTRPTRRATTVAATRTAPIARKPARPPEPQRRGAKVREKVVQALKRLHPMD
jgi:hypothetical protein